MAIHHHSSLDANLVVAFGARGRGKKNVHELFTRKRGRKRWKNPANCSRYLESAVPLSLDNISLLIAAHPLDILFFEEIKGFVAKRKEKLIFPITDKHYRSFGQFWQAKNWMSEFEARNRKLCTIIVEFN